MTKEIENLSSFSIMVLLLWIGVVIVTTVFITLAAVDNEKLTVYTVEDIYYFDGLYMTSELSSKEIYFESFEERNEFISNRTSSDNIKGVKCLNTNTYEHN